MDLLGLGSKVEIDFLLDPSGQRKQIEIKSEDNANKRILQYIYYNGEDVTGTVRFPTIRFQIFIRSFRFKSN